MARLAAEKSETARSTTLRLAASIIAARISIAVRRNARAGLQKPAQAGGEVCLVLLAETEERGGGALNSHNCPHGQPDSPGAERFDCLTETERPGMAAAGRSPPSVAAAISCQVPRCLLPSTLIRLVPLVPGVDAMWRAAGLGPGPWR